jgi:hypothetical protein
LCGLNPHNFLKGKKMPSFASLNENIKNFREEKQRRKEEETADLISRGIDIGGEDFWDDFMRLLGDGRGFAALLDINQQKVATWRNKINNALTKYSDIEEDFPERPTKRRIVSVDDYEGDT